MGWQLHSGRWPEAHGRRIGYSSRAVWWRWSKSGGTWMVSLPPRYRDSTELPGAGVGIRLRELDINKTKGG